MFSTKPRQQYYDVHVCSVLTWTAALTSEGERGGREGGEEEMEGEKGGREGGGRGGVRVMNVL